MTICAASDCAHGSLAHTYAHGVGNVGRCLAPGCCCQAFEGANRQAGKAKVGETGYDRGTNKAAPGGASTPLIQGPRRTGLEFD